MEAIIVSSESEESEVEEELESEAGPSKRRGAPKKPLPPEVEEQLIRKLFVLC